MEHICETFYRIGADNKIYGDEKGVCRVTGKKSRGVNFDKWVGKTFNDHDSLFEGDIISNEALFCFDESSEIVQKKTGKDKKQRFRTYSHIIKNGEWFCLSKAEKRKMFELVAGGAEVVCLADSGQKHIVFKHIQNKWQLENHHVVPDIKLLKLLHSNMLALLAYKFTQKQIIEGQYSDRLIFKIGVENWKKHEDILKQYRGSGIFDFSAFMLYSD